MFEPTTRDVCYLLPGASFGAGMVGFGADELEAVGLRPVFIDADGLSRRSTAVSELPEQTLRPSSLAEFDALVAGIARAGGVFVDCMVGLDEITLETRRVFSTLARHHADYIVVAAGELPPPPDDHSERSRARRRRAVGRKVLNLRQWLRLGARLAIRRLRARGRRYTLPWRVFTTHANRIETFISRYRFPRERVQWVNALDYGPCSTWLSQHDGLLPSEPFAVFLDEAAASHPDFETLDAQHLLIDSERYSSSMRQFFDEFEARTGLRVVIAAHPMSDYEGCPGFFGKREVLKAVSVDLTARSSAVIAHSSTAVGFAVIFDKPVVCVDTTEMIRVGYAAQVERIASGLGLFPLTIDDPVALSRFEWDPRRWPREGFADYRAKYLVSPEANGETTWKSVATALAERARDVAGAQESASSAG